MSTTTSTGAMRTAASVQDSDQRCPFCFTSLPRDGLFRVCPRGLRESGQPCAGAEPTLYPRFDRPVCPDHADVELIPRCQNRECAQQLPDRWNEVTTTCLAMVGTRASGKSVYLAVTADLLIKWGRRRGMTITHYNQASEGNFRDRFGSLHLDSGRLLSSTEREGLGQLVAHQEPILLRIQRPGIRDHVLVLRDIAGEDLQDPAMNARIFRFITRADGLIQLVDPMSVASMRAVLVGLVEDPANPVPPDAVWGHLQTLMFAVNGEQARYIPVALTLSKFDLVTLAAEQRGTPLSTALSGRGLRLRQDPSLGLSSWDPQDSELVDLELRTLLRKLDAVSLLKRVDHYQRTGSPVRLFAVSSLGHAPSVGRLAAQGKTPFRCLDPVLWFLARAGLS
jgi:hypothetical protein